MKAATHTRYGTPDVLTVTDVPAPDAGPGQIKVRVHASSVTRGDLRLRAADYPGLGWLLGRMVSGLLHPRHAVPGTNFAGQVVAVGEGVTLFAVGDDVFGTCDHGACAEYLVVREDGVVTQMPEGVSYVEAAATPYGGLTAQKFMHQLARVKPGEQVLIIGAAGGVGRFAVQMACHLGAEVTAVCRGRDAEQVRALGAVEIIDYTTTSFTQSGMRYDVVFDASGTAGFWRCRSVLTAQGRYLTLWLSMVVLLQMLGTKLWGRGRRALFSVALGSQIEMKDLAVLLGQRVIWPVVGEVLPLSQITEAHRLASSGGGCVVVTTGSTSSGAAPTLRATTRYAFP
ncbi:MAG: NAD(P)-dependent alcohol dehydrogenase [Bradymonadia bacterium]